MANVLLTACIFFWNTSPSNNSRENIQQIFRILHRAFLVTASIDVLINASAQMDTTSHFPLPTNTVPDCCNMKTFDNISLCTETQPPPKE
jgi:hypothetical protein